MQRTAAFGNPRSQAALFSLLSSGVNDLHIWGTRGPEFESRRPDLVFMRDCGLRAAFRVGHSRAKR